MPQKPLSPLNNFSDVIDAFGENQKNKIVFHEGECFLKTKNNKFKAHWGVIMGNDIYCYKKKGDTQHRLMHCLVGTFVKDHPEELSPGGQSKIWPIKVLLPPNKSRILYFTHQDIQQKWLQILKESVGYANLFDFYELDRTLGKG